MTKNELLTLSSRNFQKMGLDVYLAGTDYRGMKPDMVAVHKEKQIYYLIEVIGAECINTDARLNKKRSDLRIRQMCSHLYSSNALNALTAALYCDLGQGLDLFRYDFLDKHRLKGMQRYAAIVYGADIAQTIEHALQTLGIQYKSLAIQEKYFFTLFSAADTEQLADARKFMLYMLSNRDQQGIAS